VPCRPCRDLPALWLVLLVAAGAVLTGCAAALPTDFSPPRQQRLIPDLPFFAQEYLQCGPAALAAVLNHHGQNTTPQEVARDIFRPQVGTLTLDMVLHARRQGLAARWYDGSLSDLLRAVEAEKPLIVLLDQGVGPVENNHYAVVAGYAPDGVVLNSGRTEHLVTDWGRFYRQWRRAGRWTLEVGE
jgi:ABC-type bacteriocin/lantibiotic exporter with double-glycine peptidase domain